MSDIESFPFEQINQVGWGARFNLINKYPIEKVVFIDFDGTLLSGGEAFDNPNLPPDLVNNDRAHKDLYIINHQGTNVVQVYPKLLLTPKLDQHYLLNGVLIAGVISRRFAYGDGGLEPLLNAMHKHLGMVKLPFVSLFNTGSEIDKFWIIGNILEIWKIKHKQIVLIDDDSSEIENPRIASTTNTIRAIHNEDLKASLSLLLGEDEQ